MWKSLIVCALVVSFSLALVLFLLSGHTLAQALKFGTAVKMSPAYYLPVMAAEEKGFWREYR